jgi:NAD(P)-dependent dehydrogenase (short-subunit alcohol dehydrogenase family)
MKLKDKVVLITGSGSGIGREMGLLFAREGASVGINDIRPEAAQNVATEIGALGGCARPFVADVSNSTAVKRMFADLLAAFGTIDVLVNNAGIGRTRAPDERRILLTTAEITDDDWHKMIATHLDATFYCTREALKVMIPRKSGRIINQGSIAGTAGLPFASNYCAAKGGIIAFTKSVALEVARDNIFVNAIAPGFIETPMTAEMPPESREWVIRNTPVGRFGQPQDIAAAALYLASDDSNFLVGQVISPNGGWTTA